MFRRLTLLALFLLAPATAAAHCQVPCGIYDDHARVDRMLEDVMTIEKAVKKIRELAGKDDPQSVNQTVRWITTKEQHASRIIETISTYFLTQKIKLPSGGDAKAYQEKLAAHHAVMVKAMKTKQTVDPAAVTELRDAVKVLQKWWKPTK